MPGSDAALINAIRSGDPGAYDVLRSRHGAAARRLAGHLPHGQATVNDVVDWAFVQVLEAIRRGGGPTDAFRPYLLTAVQRAARDCAAGESSPIPADDQDIPDPGQLPVGGPAPATGAAGASRAGGAGGTSGTDRAASAGGATGEAAVTAFMSLPERWRAVLWHTEVEDAAPAAVASLFGLGAADAADLAARARDGMAQNAGIEPGGVHAVLRHAVAPAVLGSGAAGYLTELAYNAPPSPAPPGGARAIPPDGRPDHGPAGADLADSGPAGPVGGLLLGAPVAADADLAEPGTAAGPAESRPGTGSGKRGGSAQGAPGASGARKSGARGARGARAGRGSGAAAAEAAAPAAAGAAAAGAAAADADAGATAAGAATTGTASTAPSSAGSGTADPGAGTAGAASAGASPETGGAGTGTASPGSARSAASPSATSTTRTGTTLGAEPRRPGKPRRGGAGAAGPAAAAAAAAAQAAGAAGTGTAAAAGPGTAAGAGTARGTAAAAGAGVAEAAGTRAAAAGRAAPAGTAAAGTAAGGAASGGAAPAGSASAGPAAPGQAADIGAAETTGLPAVPAESQPGRYRAAGVAGALSLIFGRAEAWWRQASAGRKSLVAGVGVALVVAVIVGYALTLSPNSGPVTARPSRPAASPSVVAPPSSSPAATPSPTPSSTSPSVPPATVINNAGPSQAPPPPPPAARLAISLTVSGPVPFSPFASVNFSVADRGHLPTGPITAAISLPRSVSLVRSGQVGGWNCSMTGTTAICSGVPLSPGASAADFLTVTLNSPSACGQVIELTVTTRSSRASAFAAIHCAGRISRASIRQAPASSRRSLAGPAAEPARRPSA
ncbi:MAG TPA: hypothetical protein VGH88_23040 [Streptosporangiaceae bacterium]